MMNTASSPVKVKCKQCGRMANSTDFVLDPGFKMLVCPSCVKDRRAQVNKPKVEVKPEPPKPAGWDKEDEMLEKSFAAKQKEKGTPVVKLDETHVKYKCKACGYEFKYNTEKKSPGNCPYCSAAVGKMFAM